MGDVFSFLKNSTLSRSELNYESGKFKYIHYGDILTKFGDITDACNFSVPFVTTPEKVMRLEKFFLQNGDVVIADTAEDSMVGKVTEIQNSAPFPTVSGLHTIPIRPNKEFAAGFLGHYMNAPFYHDQLFKLMQGVKVLSLSKCALIQTKINSPSYCEQNLISRTINLIDSTITLHEEKKRQLVRLKSALLQKMFADENGYPSIRFRDFSSEWQLKKFKEVYAKSNEKNTRYGIQKIISVANMHYSKNTSIRSVEYLKTYNVFKVGDIAFEGNKSSRFSHGRFVENTIGDGIVSHVFDVFRPIDKHDLQFMKYYINCEYVMGPIMVRVTKASTMMTNLVAKDFLNESMRIPSISEQQHIGRLLECLDLLITLHQNKLNNLKILKNSLLQKMFI